MCSVRAVAAVVHLNEGDYWTDWRIASRSFARLQEVEIAVHEGGKHSEDPAWIHEFVDRHLIARSAR